VDNYGIYGDVNSGTAGPGKSPTPRRAGLTGNGGCGTRPGEVLTRIFGLSDL